MKRIGFIDGRRVRGFTLAGGSALNGMDLTIAETTTPSSGYAHGLHIGYNKSGIDTGVNMSLMQFNALGIDYSIRGGGGAAGYNGFYIYMAKSGSPSLASAAIFPMNLDVQEMGASDYLGCLWLQKSNTTKGTGVDTFILCSLQASGVAKSLINMQGTTLPDNFLTFSVITGVDMLVDATPGAATTKYLKVDLAGNAYAMRVESVA